MKLLLSCEDMWDRPLGGTSPDKQVPHWFGNILMVVGGLIVTVFFRFSVTGKHHITDLKDKLGAVVVSNHTSFLDVGFIYLSPRPWQYIRLLGRDSLFENGHRVAGQCLSRLGGFPIKRDTADTVAIKRAVRNLKNKELVGILPEGTRRGKSGRTPKLHAGAALIARMAKVPIIPMTVRNAENIKRKGERLRCPKVTAEFGAPLLVSDFDFLPKEQRLEGCTWYAMRQCFALSQRVAPEEVDMVALFPECFDYSPVFAEHPLPLHSSRELADAR